MNDSIMALENFDDRFGNPASDGLKVAKADVHVHTTSQQWQPHWPSHGVPSSFGGAGC